MMSASECTTVLCTSVSSTTIARLFVPSDRSRCVKFEILFVSHGRTLKTFNRSDEWILIRELTDQRSCHSCDVRNSSFVRLKSASRVLSLSPFFCTRQIILESKSNTGIAIPFGAAQDSVWNILKNCTARVGNVYLDRSILNEPALKIAVVFLFGRGEQQSSTKV